MDHLQLFFLSFLISLCGTICFNVEDPIWKQKYDHVVAFYNIYGSHRADFRSIVQEQIHTMNASGLLDRLDQIFYTTSGDQGSSFRFSDSKFRLLKDWGPEGTEDQTLGLLYRYCQSHQTAKVLYFHDKGSYHNYKVNTRFRKILDCYVLTPGCIDALDTYDTCGFKISPIPWPHYTGNYWWATCKHIAKLVDPLSPRTNATFATETKKLTTHTPAECTGTGRFFSESWVGSLPNYNPSDCLPSYINSYYFFSASTIPPDLMIRCPSRNTKQYGAECGIPHSYLYPEKYQQGFREHKDLLSTLRCFGNAEKMVSQRTLIWYGQEHTLYQNWTSMYIPVMKPKDLVEGEAIHSDYSANLYVMRQGCLQTVKTFEEYRNLKINLDNSTVLEEYEISAILCSEKQG
jgi:hypothetical protein